MTDSINREKCPWCGSEESRRAHDSRVFKCGSSVWSGGRGQSSTCWNTQRDTLKSKLAQAVEALEATHAHVSDMLNAWADGHVTDCSGCPSRSNENARIEVLVRSTLSALKDNPQPINKDNP